MNQLSVVADVTNAKKGDFLDNDSLVFEIITYTITFVEDNAACRPKNPIKPWYSSQDL